MTVAAKSDDIDAGRRSGSRGRPNLRSIHEDGCVPTRGSLEVAAAVRWPGEEKFARPRSLASLRDGVPESLAYDSFRFLKGPLDRLEESPGCIDSSRNF